MPSQDCDLDVRTHFTDKLTGLIGGTPSGEPDCSDDPDVSGKCLATLQGIYSGIPGGETAFNAAVKLTSTELGVNPAFKDAKGLCDHYCSEACYGVGGFAMWVESPCIDPLSAADDDDLKGIVTLRFRCMPPWGLVILFGIVGALLLVGKMLGGKKKNNTAGMMMQPVQVQMGGGMMQPMQHGQWTVLATATVRNGLSTKSKEVRQLKSGTVVQVFEQGESEGHQRVR